MGLFYLEVHALKFCILLSFPGALRCPGILGWGAESSGAWVDFGFDYSAFHAERPVRTTRCTLWGGGRGSGGGSLSLPWSSVGLSFPSPEPPERDSTVAVIVGASVGGFLAVVILVLMVVKCVRRKKEQKLSTDDLKTEEEGKTDGEGNADEGPK